MSIYLMSQAYRVKGLTTAQKAVLVVLCDHANDDGQSCYPSIPRIARHSSLSERTVYRVLSDLEEAGYIKREAVRGRPSQFTIDLSRSDPCQIVTPDTMAEAPDMVAEAPDTVSPKPSITTTNRQSNNKARKPDCVSEGVWSDFQSLRKAKKAPLTPTALKRIESEAAKAGWSLEDALSECSARGWQGFNAEWVKEARNDNRNNRSGGGQGGDGFIRALDRKLASHAEGSGPGQTSSEVGAAGHRLALVDQRRSGSA